MQPLHRKKSSCNTDKLFPTARAILPKSLTDEDDQQLESDDDSFLPDEDYEEKSQASQPVTASQAPRKLMGCMFIDNPRLDGHPLLQDNNYFLYRRRQHSKKSGTTYYSCYEFYTGGCLAKASYNPGRQAKKIVFKNKHNHLAKPEKTRALIEERKVVDSIVDSCASVQDITPRKLLSTVLHRLDTPSQQSSMPYVSKKEVLKSRLRRARQKKLGSIPEKVPTTWEDIKKGLPEQLQRLSDGSVFLRYNGPVTTHSDERMLIFASDAGIKLLETAERASGDGTFSTVPAPFKQLFVVMADLKGGSSTPVVYGLLPNKKAETYDAFFNVVRGLSDNIFKGIFIFPNHNSIR